MLPIFRQILISTTALLIVGNSTETANAKFTGQLKLSPADCKQSRVCKLEEALKYRDPNDLEWQAAAGNETDGASIPKWAQPFVGQPFEESFIKAAVIHDHYCDRHVRGWRATHRMFYDALLELGVPISKAKLMYYAVFLGGPKWVKLIPGKECGENCLFKVEVPGSNDLMNNSQTIIARGDNYEQPGFLEELKEVDKILNNQGEQIDLTTLERRARDKRPNDFYYQNEDEIEVTTGLDIQ
jgi:hypothetical protein